MVFDGTWRVIIATPIGKQEVVFEISTDQGVVRGIATQAAERVDFLDPVIDGERLTWSQRITKPFSMLLHFDVTVDGDRMAGTAKAGVLPTSSVIGERVA